MKKYYTIYLGKEIWENEIDDMNSSEIWARGGIIWKKKQKAFAYMKNLKRYNFETKKRKYHIVKLVPINNHYKKL